LPQMTAPTAALITPVSLPGYLNLSLGQPGMMWLVDEFQHNLPAGITANGTVLPGPFSWYFTNAGAGCSYRSAGTQFLNPGSGQLVGPASLSSQSGTATNYGFTLTSPYPIYAHFRFRLSMGTGGGFAIGFASDVLSNVPVNGFWIQADPTTYPGGALITQKGSVVTGATPLGITWWGGSGLGDIILVFDGNNISVYATTTANQPPVFLATVTGVFSNNLLLANAGVMFVITAKDSTNIIFPDLFEVLMPMEGLGTFNSNVASRFLWGP
jgi:hypothetical protein